MTRSRRHNVQPTPGPQSRQTPVQDPVERDNRKEASKTYLEQTKLLTTLASSFIVAPAVLFKDMSAITPSCIIWMEGLFIFSVLCGYITIATMTGSQEEGKFDVYRNSTRIASLLQLGCYLAGLVILVTIFLGKRPAATTTENQVKDTIWMKAPDTLLMRIVNPTVKERIFIGSRRKPSRAYTDSCCNCK